MGWYYCAYLRLKQKDMDTNECLMGKDFHRGAHFPLCVFTNNARARGAEKARERSQQE